MGLTQDDFRKILATPRSAPAAGAADSSGDFAAPAVEKAKKKKSGHRPPMSKEKQKELAERRAAQKAVDEKYRDRAKERRKGENRDYTDTQSLVAAYASASVSQSAEAEDITEEQKRLKAIEESKFLGGDLEHTHLVKGLDYALLQKVRSEGSTQDSGSTDTTTATDSNDQVPVSAGAEAVEATTIRSRMARGVYNVLFNPDKSGMRKNELFQPGRMAYMVDLDDRSRDAMDAPTTVIRSKADLGNTASSHIKVSNNDIVINKLCQIISYLRSGDRQSVKKRKGAKEKRVVTEATPVASSKPMKSKISPAAPPADDDLDIYGETDNGPGLHDNVQTSTIRGEKKSYFGTGSGATSSSERDWSKAHGATQNVLDQLKKSALAVTEPEDKSNPEAEREADLDHSTLRPKMSRKERRRLERQTGAQKAKPTGMKAELEDSYSEYFPGAKVGSLYDGFDSEDEEPESTRGEDNTSASSGKSAKKGKEKERLNNELTQINNFIEKRKAEKAAGGSATKKSKTSGS